MKLIALAALAGTFASAADSIPTQEALAEALTLAQNQWGYEIKDATIQFRLEPLNACPLAVDHDIATTQLLDYVTTTRFEGDAPPVVSHAYTYVIRINSACDWSQLDLIATVEHEYGHILIGSGKGAGMERQGLSLKKRTFDHVPRGYRTAVSNQA